jgi:protein-tyrosine phosphatase
MIDIHNHLLPGIDDGAQNLDEALGLARAAVANGITHCLCTPHIHFGRFDNTARSINSAYQVLSKALKEQNIPLKLGRAAEVRFDIEVLTAIDQNEIPFLGQWQGEKVLLLEFPHGELPIGAEQLVKILRSRGVLPMIAHPERNKGLMRRPEDLKPLLKQGCLLQLTASSVIGGFGERAEELALSLLADDVVTVIATDTHHIKRRPPLLREAYTRIVELYGEALADRLVHDNPWTIAQEHFE